MVIRIKSFIYSLLLAVCSMTPFLSCIIAYMALSTADNTVRCLLEAAKLNNSAKHKTTP